MGNKFSKTILYFVSVSLLMAFLCAKCNNKAHPSINAYTIKNTDDWERTKRQVIDTSNSIRVKLQILNNPYNFKEKNNLTIYIDQTLVFKGSFDSINDVYIPDRFFNNRVLPSIIVYDGNVAHNFIHKRSMFLNSEDRYLYVVFCPDNELAESCYMFSQKEPLL